MATGIPTRLTRPEGRKFGVTVGLAFVVLASIAWWRDHILLRAVLGSIGGALLVAGLVIPQRLGPIYRGWMAFAMALSKITTPIFMGVVFFVVIAPIGILRRTIGRNPLTPQSHEGGFWQPRPSRSEKSTGMERQF